MATAYVNPDLAGTGTVGGADSQPPGQAGPVSQSQPSDLSKLYFGKFREKDLVEQLTRKWTESDERLRDFFNIALECWDNYRNKQDFSDKEDWQSQVTLAKAHAAVKQGVANIRKLFLQARDPVTVEDPSGRNAPFVPYVQETVKQLWDRANFLDVTSEALEAGLIMGLIAVRCDWLYEDLTSLAASVGPDGQPSLQQAVTKEGRFALRAIDPWNIRWGAETNPDHIDWIIEQRIISIPSLRKLGFTIPDEILRSDFKANELEQRNRRRKDEIDARQQFEHRVKVWDYWGPLIDEKTQETIVENAHVVLANKQKVLLAEENPVWRRKPPYVLASPLRVAFRFPGQGILEVNRALKANMDAIAQMGSDYLKFSTLPMFEVDMSALENPEDIATGAEPGKMFRKRPGAGGTPAIQQIQIHPIAGDFFNMLLAFDHEYQRASFITEVVQGLVDAKGETTATEVQSVVAQSTVMLSSIARDLEEQYIENLADATWDYALQFMDSTSNPNWEKIVGPAGQQLDYLSRPERLALIQGRYEFKARGISLQVERQAELQKLVNYLSVIGQYAPQFVPLLNMPEIFKRIHESFSFPRYNELLAPNAGEMFPMMQQNLMQQQSPQEQFAARAGQKLIEGLMQHGIEQTKAAAKTKPNGGANQ